MKGEIVAIYQNILLQQNKLVCLSFETFQLQYVKLKTKNVLKEKKWMLFSLKMYLAFILFPFL